MRIGVYTECLARNYTGVETQTHLLVEGLSRTANEITCFHSKNYQHPDFGVNHHLFQKPLPIPFYNSLSPFFRISCFDDVDLLHLPYPKVPYVKKPRVPVVLTIHDVTPIFLPEFHNWKRNFFFKRMLPFYLRRCDAIVASSYSTKSDIIRYYGIPAEKITVVHLALPEKERVVSKKRGDFILYLGTLEPRKNIENLIRAFVILKSSGFKEKLVIAGNKGWQWKGIFELVKRHNLQNDVIFKGYVSESEKELLYQKAKLFVWPSFYEGFGLPVAEAMAHGTPVVTSNVSSLPEVAGDAGVLVDPHKPQDIARGMVEALSNKSLVKKGLRRVKLFSLKNMIRKTLGVYEGVLKR